MTSTAIPPEPMQHKFPDEFTKKVFSTWSTPDFLDKSEPIFAHLFMVRLGEPIQIYPVSILMSLPPAQCPITLGASGTNVEAI